MFDCGDVVAYQSLTAGKRKYHLCLGSSGDAVVLLFLHINSGTGYAGDCVFEDGEIDGLPESPTGETIVSFSQLIRMPVERLSKLQPEKLSSLPQNTIEALLGFAKTTVVLTAKERQMIVEALEASLPA